MPTRLHSGADVHGRGRRRTVVACPQPFPVGGAGMRPGLGMDVMSWIAPTAMSLEILLLLYVAMADIATRLIRNEMCLMLALLGIVCQFASQTHVAESLIA